LERKEVEPLCFLSFWKSATYHLKRDGEKDSKMDLQSVMFCFDSIGIFDKKYNGMVRDKFGLSSWSNVTEKTLPDVLHGLYWFRKHSRRFHLRDIVEEAIKVLPFGLVLLWIKQSIHMINGLILKQLFSLGPEMGTYAKLSEDTARLFKQLFTEYMGREFMAKHKTKPIFEECKDLSKAVKEHGTGLSYELRTSFLDWEFKNPALAGFFLPPFKRLKAYVGFFKTKGIDVTTSLAWKFRIAELHQTRVLGYVPTHLADKLSATYRQDVTRSRKPQDPKRLRLIELLVLQEMLQNSGIKPEFLRQSDLSDSEEIEKIRRILSKIELDLKPTASIHHLVREGGKLEDARQVLKAIRDQKLLIPIRNLETLEIKKTLPLLEVDYPDDISVYLFYSSIQMVMNFLVDRGKLVEDFYVPLKGLEKFENKVLEAVIVHIDEPGKLRELIKNSPILSWFLSPGSKLCQATLALHPDHKAGLEFGNQDWSHIKRISGDSSESRFMYGPDGKTKSDIQFGYEDWSQATDFLSRLIGLTELKAFMQYIGFPKGYGNLILTISEMPQRVSTLVRYRIIGLTNDEDQLEKIEIPFEGWIHEGFMMGNQITKTILHLTHLGQKALALAKLKSQGIEFRNRNIEGVKKNSLPTNLRDLKDTTI
jgi:hypothetical protein